jgi:RNA polymerase sigma-70 factor, ECF subfamily
VHEALRHRPPGRFALMAAIAAVHDEAPTWDETDWREIVALYGLLVQIWPSPVVALNRGVAIGFADGPDAGLDALDALAEEPQLAGYSYLAAHGPSSSPGSAGPTRPAPPSPKRCC